MSLPIALVKVGLVRLEGIPASVHHGSGRIFAVAAIADRAIGRSRVLASGDTTLALGWTHIVAAMSRDPIPITVTLWDDRWSHRTRQVGPQSTVFLAPPFTSGDYDSGSSPRLVYRVETTSIPRPASASVPRSPGGGGGATSVAAPAASTTLVTEITDVQGLYQPRTGGGAPLSRRVPGYLSEDDRGRIFIDRSLSGGYRRNHQSIRLSAQVHSPTGGSIPAGAKIRWTIFDPDDTFDVDPYVHRQWLHYLDDDDYQRDGTPTGEHGNDNEGRAPRWRAVRSFSIESESGSQAMTALVNGRSQINIDCPDVGGDSLIVEAKVVDAPGTHVAARTGIMTMWKRIDVEYVRMPSALRLPVERIPPMFEDAFVEMNFAAERVLPAGQDRAEMAPSHSDLNDECNDFIRANFTHRRDGGWFFLASANLPQPTSTSQRLYRPTGPAWTTDIVHEEELTCIEVPGPVAAPADGGLPFAGALLHWPAVQDPRGIFFQVHSIGDTVATPAGHPARSATPPVTQLTDVWLRMHDLQRRFRGHGSDGSEGRAYSHSDFYAPRTPNGDRSYGAPEEVTVDLVLPGGPGTAGNSPFSNGHFAGNTIVYSHHPSYYDAATRDYKPDGRDNIVRTIAHELTHAFGMPHRCGFFDVRSPRARTTGANTCFMNYNYVWMADGDGNLIPNTMDMIGNSMCGRHAKEVRRIKLSDNPELRRRGW